MKTIDRRIGVAGALALGMALAGCTTTADRREPIRAGEWGTGFRRSSEQIHGEGYLSACSSGAAERARAIVEDWVGVIEHVRLCQIDLARLYVGQSTEDDLVWRLEDARAGEGEACRSQIGRAIAQVRTINRRVRTTLADAPELCASLDGADEMQRRTNQVQGMTAALRRDIQRFGR